MSQNLREQMKFHNGTYKFVIGLISIAIFDLLVGRIWLTASCLALWAMLLMRNPSRVRSRHGVVSPVMGIMKRILNIDINGEKREHLKVDTRPLIDSQTFRIVSNDSVSSINSDSSSITVEYSSGMIIKHMPLYPRLGGLVLDADKNVLDGTDEYGYSIFGCTTSIILPSDYRLCISDGDMGRLLIDGETIIAHKEKR